MAICPKKVGLKKHSIKTIFPTCLLNSSLAIFEIPKIVEIEKINLVKCIVSISYFFGNILVIKTVRVSKKPG